tara:strand:- start:7658 stop:7927 length:270 start_codon:yes stop_codon:yes gene_type:complete
LIDPIGRLVDPKMNGARRRRSRFFQRHSGRTGNHIEVRNESSTMSILASVLRDRALIRNLSIGFAIGTAGLFAATGFPIASDAIAAVFV